VHYVITWLIVGLLALFIDLAYARWTANVAKGRVVQAMLWSAICPIASFGSFWICVHDLPALIPTAVGCALGTWLSMRWK
jgi:hypothetical protein